MPALGHPATAQGSVLLGDWTIFLYTAIAVYAVVVVLILIPAIVWRRRGETLPAQFGGNSPLEIGYTIAPLLIVAALFYVTLTREWRVEAESPKPYTTVLVTGFRWSWRFEYPSTGLTITGTPQSPPELALPLRETTQIDLTSSDVNHAFWVPQFLFKRDAIAGFRNSFDLTPTRAGVYRGVCAEFCGLAHAGMTFTVRVLPRREFDVWLARGGKPAQP